jgi:hypothetical protein
MLLSLLRGLLDAQVSPPQSRHNCGCSGALWAERRGERTPAPQISASRSHWWPHLTERRRLPELQPSCGAWRPAVLHTRSRLEMQVCMMAGAPGRRKLVCC